MRGLGQIGTIPGSSGSHTVVETARDLGALVRMFRKREGMTQQAFADLAGVGRRFVSELEAGKGTIGFDKALQVARALGIVLTARIA